MNNKRLNENTTLTFDDMKAYIEREDPDGVEFAHHGPYADYINSFYSKALDGISDEIEFEPNIQNGRGSMRIYGLGLSYEYDYEEECQKLLEIASDSDTEEELESRIKDYVDELISQFESEGISVDEYDDDMTGNWY